MHELSLMNNVIDILHDVAKKNKLKKVTKVKLEIGQMMQVVPHVLVFAYETVTKGTIFEGSKLDIEIIPIKTVCADCKKEFDVDDNIYICPNCGSKNLGLVTGKELLIKSMEGD